MHWPGCTWQSLSTLHAWPSTLQTWEDGQARSFLHVEPVTLQAPGQSAAVWQIEPSLLHVLAGQVVVSVHEPHSLVHRLHPGGFQSVVQADGSGGLQTATRRLQCGVVATQV